MLELELKGVVADPDRLRRRLSEGGFVPEFAGRMLDRRFDRGGEFAYADEVVRVRTYHHRDGTTREVLGWKGATSVSPDGYKARQELESTLDGGAPAAAILERLKFDVVHAIDRYVEVYRVADAMVRLEWYPECDTLVEIEGNADAIEAAILVLELRRSELSAEPLASFAVRYQERCGRPARLALRTVDEAPAHWPAV